MTAEAGTTDASPASSTGNTGDISTGSPAVDTGTATAAPKSGKDSIREALAAKREAKAARTAGEQRPAADVPDAGDAELDGERSPKDQKSKQKSDDQSVPLKAHIEERKKLQAKAEEFRSQLATKDHEVAKASEAIRLLSAQVESLTARLKQSGGLSDQDERLMQYELAEQARAREADLRAQFEQRAQQQANDVAISTLAEQLSADIEGALAKHDLVSRELLIARMRTDQRSALEIAAEMEAALLERVKPRLANQRPSLPSTVRPQRSGGASAVRHDLTTKQGIAERLAAGRAAYRGD